MRAPNMFDTREQKKCFKSCLIKCLMTFKCYQTRPNTIKQHQIRWPNGKMFGHQTMFDGVWSPNISRLDMPLDDLWLTVLLNQPARWHNRCAQYMFMKYVKLFPSKANAGDFKTYLAMKINELKQCKLMANFNKRC